MKLEKAEIVHQHLEETAKLTVPFAASFQAREQGALVMLAHNIGK